MCLASCEEGVANSCASPSFAKLFDRRLTPRLDTDCSWRARCVSESGRHCEQSRRDSRHGWRLVATRRCPQSCKPISSRRISWRHSALTLWPSGGPDFSPSIQWDSFADLAYEEEHTAIRNIALAESATWWAVQEVLSLWRRDAIALCLPLCSCANSYFCLLGLNSSSNRRS